MKYLVAFFLFLVFPPIMTLGETNTSSVVGIDVNWDAFDVTTDDSDGTTTILSNGSSDATGSGYAGTDTSTTASEATGITDSRTCRRNEYNQPFIALNFLKKVANPKKIYFEDISINDFGELEGSFHLGTYISACFEPSMVAERVGDKVFIRMANIYFDKHKDSLSEDVLNAPNVDAKYQTCLREQGLLKDGRLDMSKIRSQNLINSEASFEFVNKDGKPLQGFDKDMSYQLHFASNSASSYTREGERTRGTPRDWRCTSYDPLSNGDHPFIRGPVDAILVKANELCNDQDPAKMIKEILKLRDSSVGNAKELASILDHVFINRLKQRQDDLFEDGDGDLERGLEKLEKRMRKLLRKSRKNRPDEDGELAGEANQVAREYKRLLKKLEREVFDPATALMTRLHEEYKTASENEKTIIKDKLDKLSKIMARLSKKRKKYSCNKIPCSFYKRFYIHEGEDGFDTDATLFERLRLASNLWSKAKKRGRGRGLGPKRIKRKISKGIGKFEKIVSDGRSSWANEAAILEGDASPLRDTERRITRGMKRIKTIQQNYYENQRKELGIWCSSASTQHCHKKRARRDRRYRQMIELLGKKVQRDQGLVQHYGTLWEQYQDRAEEEGEYFDNEYGEYGYDGYDGGGDFPGWDSGGGYQGPYAPDYYHYNNAGGGGGLPPYGNPYHPNNYHLNQNQGPPFQQQQNFYNPYTPPERGP